MEYTCWDKLEFQYEEPSPKYVESELLKIEEQIKEFCNATDIDPTRIEVNVKTLKDIIIRLDMRRLYFHIYHKKMDANEYKVNAGLFVFWILKLRPFWMRIQEDDTDELIETANSQNTYVIIKN